MHADCRIYEYVSIYTYNQLLGVQLFTQSVINFPEMLCLI